MSRKTARFTQADIARCLRAAKAVGGQNEVIIESDGKIIIRPSTGSTQENQAETVEAEEVVPL